MDYDKYNQALGLNSANLADPNTGQITLGSLVGGILPYILTLAGLVLLFMLVAGGFTMLTGATSPESQEKGKKQITTALTGFIILFAAYWIAQALQVVFKIDIVG